MIGWEWSPPEACFTALRWELGANVDGVTGIQPTRPSHAYSGAPLLPWDFLISAAILFIIIVRAWPEDTYGRWQNSYKTTSNFKQSYEVEYEF